MADHPTSTAHPTEHAHPGARQYLGIAVVLTVITAIEVGVFYMPSMRTMLVPTLLTLSALKFALVAMFYMHLRFDSKLFSWLFVFPLVIIGSILVALMAMQRLLG